MMELRTWIVLVVLTNVQSQTIKQILDGDYSELTLLKSYLNSMKRDIYTQKFASNSGQQYTFFAPNNKAFEKLPKGQRDLYRSASLSASDDFKQLLEFHTVIHDATFLTVDADPIAMSKFTDKTQKLGNMAGSIIFYVKNGPVYYVNGARITSGDIAASNGVVHIVDTIMFTQPILFNIYSRLNGQLTQNTKSPQPKFTKFMSLLKAYEQQATTSPNAISCLKHSLTTATVFAPLDKAFNDISTIQFNQLKGNPKLLQTVIGSHVVCSGVHFTNMLYDERDGPGISALEGTIKSKTFLYRLSVSNGCIKGEISTDVANITVANGVIQPIDKLLGYIYHNTLEELNSVRDVSIRNFYRYAQSSREVKEKLISNAMHTIFVPKDSNYDLSQRDNLQNILLSHMIPGQINLDMMSSGSSYTTLGKKDEFSRENTQLIVHIETDEDDEQQYYVSVNNVRGRIIRSDICTSNGVMHIVDTLLAVASVSPMQFLKEDHTLSAFYRELQDMNHFLDDQQKILTIFAPTDQAFSEMRKSKVGNSLLGFNYRQAFRRVMDRHIILREKIVLSEARLPLNNIQTEFDEISIKRIGREYEVTFNKGQSRAKIISADNIVTNGVMHIIDEVLFIDDMNSNEITGSSNMVVSSAMLIFFILYGGILLL